MKRFTDYSKAALAILILASCSNKEDQVIGSPEEVLPGLWKIASIELTDYNEGVTYQGNTFFNDTTLTHVGKIQISTFSLDSLEPLDLGQHRVECLLDISGGEMNVSFNSLYQSGTGWQTVILYNGPDGYQAIDTPIEEFYYTSHVFNNFYTLEIEDNNRVKLLTSNDEENHVITIVRD